MAITFLEAGTSSTYDTKLWTNTSGTVTSDSAVTDGNPRSLKGDVGGLPTVCWARRTGIFSDSGSRCSWRWQVSALPTATTTIWRAETVTSGTVVLSLSLRTDGKLSMAPAGVGSVVGTAILSAGTWVRISVVWVITSTTNFTVKVFVDGVLDITVTQADGTITTTGSNAIKLGFAGTAWAANTTWNADHVYADDSAALTDPDNVRCTHKSYIGTSEGVGTNDWDTNIGAPVLGFGGRYVQVSNRPASDSNAWEQAGTTQKYEKYLLEGAAGGDTDISAQTLVGWMAWVRVKTSASSSAASIVDNDTDTTISTTTTIAQFLHLTTSATYPTGRFGMRSTGSSADTFFYEGGVVVAYVPGGGGGATVRALAALGVG